MQCGTKLQQEEWVQHCQEVSLEAENNRGLDPVYLTGMRNSLKRHLLKVMLEVKM